MPSLSRKRYDQLLKLQSLPPSEDDPHSHIKGVLLSDEIQYYVAHHHLITPFNVDNLNPAGYELTIGDEYFLNGEFRTLDTHSNDNIIIRIPPFEVAVLKTTEILCLPRYLIGRWNIKVRHAYAGLLWVGGPQVDPGYVGHLFCPIYNLSDSEIILHAGDPIAVIDFVKTTPFDKTKSNQELKRFPFPPARKVMEDYNIDNLRSALFTTAGQKLPQFEEEIRTLTTRFASFTQLSFAIFGIIIALVAIISRTNAESLELGASVWGAGTIAISVAAFLIAISSRVSQRVGELVYERYGRVMAEKAKTAMGFLHRAWWTGFAISLLLAIAIGIALYLQAEPVFSDLRRDRVVAKSDLDRLNGSIDAKFHEQIERLAHIEQRRTATLDDLAKLKATLEQEIQSIGAREK